MGEKKDPPTLPAKRHSKAHVASLVAAAEAASMRPLTREEISRGLLTSSPTPEGGKREAGAESLPFGRGTGGMKAAGSHVVVGLTMHRRCEEGV